jgi:hypothetical protein
MRQKLAGEWSTFLPSEKSNCIAAEMAGMASYTDLTSCLENGARRATAQSEQIATVLDQQRLATYLLVSSAT